MFSKLRRLGLVLGCVLLGAAGPAPIIISLTGTNASGANVTPTGSTQQTLANALTNATNLTQGVIGGSISINLSAGTSVQPWFFQQNMDPAQASGTVLGGFFQNTISGSPLGRARVLTGSIRSTALLPVGAAGSDGQHVAVAANIVRDVPAGGVPVGRVMAPVWSIWSTLADRTNLPSSQSGTLINEYDSNANGQDDGNARASNNYSIKEWFPVGASGGYPLEWGCVFCISGSTTGVVKAIYTSGEPYGIAQFDLRNSPQQQGVVVTTASAGSSTVSISNVVAFMSAGVTHAAVGVGNPLPITINGVAYSVTAATFDAPVGGVTTVNGTITLATPIVGTDGTAGNAVIPQGRTIWLKRPQQIAYNQSGTLYDYTNDDTSITTVGERKTTGSSYSGAWFIVNGNDASSGFLTAAGNAGIGYNFSNGGGELDLMNNVVSSSSHTRWYHRTSPSVVVQVAALTNAGNFVTTTLQSTAGTVSALPTCNAAAEGTRGAVTDASAPTYLGTLTGGGAVHSSAYCNGTAWVSG